MLGKIGPAVPLLFVMPLMGAGCWMRPGLNALGDPIPSAFLLLENDGDRPFNRSGLGVR